MVYNIQYINFIRLNNLKTKFELVEIPNDLFSIFNRIIKDEKFYTLFKIFQKNLFNNFLKNCYSLNLISFLKYLLFQFLI